MGYQALLFCPDEKLARVVSQVFAELDFSIEPVSEPFGAVKKLMSQRYDAIVVDCDNEQNTSLLFKSARNSSVNQGSLAIALVEGQAGVAKAYRIGANLVLTKPINVEQSKGTLRVARGLLRKASDPAAPASASTPTAPPTPKQAPTAASRPAQPSVREATPAVAPSRPAAPEIAAPLPAMAASLRAEEKPASIPAPVAQAQTPMAANPPFHSTPSYSADDEDVLGAEESKTESPALAPVLNIAAKSQGAAAAPAPAKETAHAPAVKEAPKEKETVAEKGLPTPEAAKSEPPALDWDLGNKTTVADGPSFAALGVDEAEDSGGRKKIFIIIAVVAALAIAAYLGWTQFGPGKASPSHVSAPSPSAQPAQVPMSSAPASGAPASSTPASSAGMPATSSSGTPAPSTSASAASASAVPAEPSTSETAKPNAPAPVPAASKPSATHASQPSTVASSAGASSERLALNTEPEARKTAPPTVVKPSAPASKPKAPAEEAAVAPSLAAVEPASNANLSGLISTPSNVSKPTLVRINVSQGVSQGLLIKRVSPKYPPQALAAHLEGAVQIEATIDKEGNVVNLKVLKGEKMLAAAALEAVRQWRYKPYMLDGSPVEIQTQITVNFKGN